MTKLLKKKKPSKVDELTEECSECKTDIWRCNDCKIAFKPTNTQVVCIKREGMHLCKMCFDAWAANGAAVVMQ